MGRLSLSSRLQTILQPRMKFGLPPAPAPAPHLAAKFYHGTVSIGSSVAGDPYVCMFKNNGLCFPLHTTSYTNTTYNNISHFGLRFAHALGRDGRGILYVQSSIPTY